jgi:hypothetical protein
LNRSVWPELFSSFPLCVSPVMAGSIHPSVLWYTDDKEAVQRGFAWGQAQVQEPEVVYTIH